MVAGFKKRLLIKSGIAAAIILALAIFIILLNTDINKHIDEIIAANQEFALRSQTFNLLSSSNTDLKRAQPLLETLQTILPSKDQLITFPDELQKSANGYGVSVGFSFGSETPSTATQPGNIKFTMTLAGSFTDIVQYLKFIEGHRYFIRLDSVDIRRETINFSLLTGGVIFTKN